MILILLSAGSLTGIDTATWRRNDPARPQPEQVAPGTTSTAPPPRRAVILFDGTDLSAWNYVDGTGWTLQHGTLVAGGTTRNYLSTKRRFSDCRIHVEFMTPAPPSGAGQKRGNSGIFLMGIYELQILDPIDNPTFADGLPGAIFGQTPPRVLAAKRPGEWQSYDIDFTAPRFVGERLRTPPVVTVRLNGIVVQKSTVIRGDTVPHDDPATYATPANDGPLVLQDHGNPEARVAFRNIWVLPLNGRSHGG